MSKLHDIKQTNANKVIVDDYLVSLLQERKCTKEELKDLLHKSERYVRYEIQKVSLFYPVISYSDAKGYRIVNTKEVVKRNDPMEMAIELHEIEHTLNELKSRIEMLKKKEHKLIASKKVLEKCLKEQK